MSHLISLYTAKETEKFGAHLSDSCQGYGLIFLKGELGAGKTTLTRGLVHHFGHQGAVKSPTYTLVESYTIKEQKIYHFDLYRISDPEELEFIGIRDYLAEKSLVIIEWPEKAQSILPQADLTIQLCLENNHRKITWRSDTLHGETISEQLCHSYKLKK